MYEYLEKFFDNLKNKDFAVLHIDEWGFHKFLAWNKNDKIRFLIQLYDWKEQDNKIYANEYVPVVFDTLVDKDVFLASFEQFYNSLVKTSKELKNSMELAVKECINKEELNVQNQRILLISQLKIFGIWYIVAYICCLYYFYWTIYQEDSSISIIPTSFTLPFILLFVILIVNLPAILILFLLFKKYKNRRSRIICASISIPFTIAIYVILGYFFLDALESALAIATIGSAYVFFTIITLIATAIAPKSLIPNKIDIISTIIFTVLFSVGLFVISSLIIHLINCF